MTKTRIKRYVISAALAALWAWGASYSGECGDTCAAERAGCYEPREPDSDVDECAS